MIHLCLLAAGNSRRFGSNKLLHEYQGKPLWRYGYEVLQKVSTDEPSTLHVVSRFPEILSAASACGVYAEEGEKGLSYTIRAVLKACAPVSPSDRLLFLVGDQPFISEETVEKVLAVALSEEEGDGKPMAVCTFDGERTGNPVCFSGLCYDLLMALEGDRGGKAIFRFFPDRIATVGCAPEELRDIDLLEDL